MKKKPHQVTLEALRLSASGIYKQEKIIDPKTEEPTCLKNNKALGKI